MSEHMMKAKKKVMAMDRFSELDEVLKLKDHIESLENTLRSITSEPEFISKLQRHCPGSITINWSLIYRRMGR